MKWRPVLGLLAGLWTCSSALATDFVSNVTITNVRVDSTGKGIVFFSGALSGNLACVQRPYYANAVAFDTNTAGGKSILAFALTAQATGTAVQVYGLGFCSIYGNYVEDVDYISS